MFRARKICFVGVGKAYLADRRIDSMAVDESFAEANRTLVAGIAEARRSHRVHDLLEVDSCSGHF